MRYFINTHMQDNGDYEVHTEVCSYGKLVQNPHNLGSFMSCQPAVELAKKLFGVSAREHGGQVNGCYYCCNPCHTE